MERKQWMREALERAATHFSLTLHGEPMFGWYERTIGRRARRGNESYWLRVVSEHKEWTNGEFWIGNEEALESLVLGNLNLLILPNGIGVTGRFEQKSSHG
jgi:hypothetical protein